MSPSPPPESTLALKPCPAGLMRQKPVTPARSQRGPEPGRGPPERPQPSPCPEVRSRHRGGLCPDLERDLSLVGGRAGGLPSRLLVWLLQQTLPSLHTRRLCDCLCRVTGGRTWFSFSLRDRLVHQAVVEVTRGAPRARGSASLARKAHPRENQPPCRRHRPGCAVRVPGPGAEREKPRGARSACVGECTVQGDRHSRYCVDPRKTTPWAPSRPLTHSRGV